MKAKVFVLVRLWDDYNSFEETFVETALYRTKEEAVAARDKEIREYVKEYLNPENEEDIEEAYQSGFVKEDGKEYWHHESSVNEYDYHIEIQEKEL